MRLTDSHLVVLFAAYRNEDNALEGDANRPAALKDLITEKLMQREGRRCVITRKGLVAMNQA